MWITSLILQFKTFVRVISEYTGNMNELCTYVCLYSQFTATQKVTDPLHVIKMSEHNLKKILSLWIFLDKTFKNLEYRNCSCTRCEKNYQ